MTLRAALLDKSAQAIGFDCFLYEACENSLGRERGDLWDYDGWGAYDAALAIGYPCWMTCGGNLNDAANNLVYSKLVDAYGPEVFVDQNAVETAVYDVVAKTSGFDCYKSDDCDNNLSLAIAQQYSDVMDEVARAAGY